MIRFLFLITFAVGLSFFLVACSNEKSTSDSGQGNPLAQETASTSEKVIEEKELPKQDTEEALFEELQVKYKAKGFESFCELKADLDSVFLIANYMAKVIYGEESFNAARTSLADWIEHDRLVAYYRKHNLNSEDVAEDLLKFTRIRNNFCKSYLDRRYQSDLNEINKVINLRLAEEAHTRYTP